MQNLLNYIVLDQSIKIVMLKEFSNSLGYILDKYKTSFLSKKEE